LTAKTTKTGKASPSATPKGKAAPAKASVAKKAVAAKPSPAKKASPPASKSAVKPAAKPVSKSSAKSVKTVPIASKTPAPKAKSAPAAQPSKPAAAVKTTKAVAAPAKTAAKSSSTATKPAAKPGTKTVSKPAAKPAAKVAAKVAPVAPAQAPTPATTPSVPQKAARPSSRLAQLTVPSMAQSVASTAAKSSYGPASEVPIPAPLVPTVVKKDSKLANNWKNKPVDQLTDPEILAMPDSEYMNDVQLAAFRLKLVVLKRDILSNAGETTEHLREDTSVVPDPADRATIEEEHALELRTRDRERKLLKKIEQSISRIDAGDYGYCDETGEPIGVGRLLARPTATLSLEAQQRHELKQKMFGD